MYNRRYDKILIQMKQDTHGFSSNERPVSGSCTIEIKNNIGIIRIYIQNLKQSKTYKFSLYGISVNKNSSEGINICEISPDNTGSFEHKIEFDPEKFMEQEKTIEDINVIAVICEKICNKNETEPLLCPLCGYTDMKINWKNRFKILEQNTETKKDEQLKTDIGLNEEEKEILKNILLSEENKEENQKIDIEEIENHNNNIIEEEKTIYSTEAILKKEFENIFLEKDYKPNIEKDKKTFKINSSDIFSQITEKFNKELEILEKSGIFTKEDILKITGNEIKYNNDNTNTKDINIIDLIFIQNQKTNIADTKKEWIICDLNESLLLPIEEINYIKNPFILYSFKKYNHIIIGRDKEKEKYYIGIPDYYSDDYKYISSNLGFNEFIKKDNNNWGYWIKEL